MREGALHLTPVRRILQMRASLGHIDEFEEKELMEMETIDDKVNPFLLSDIYILYHPTLSDFSFSILIAFG